ncbi:MAG: hypothetical protein WAK12_04430 [Acidimicrobiales bacterium]
MVVYANGDWITFHTTADNHTGNIVAAFPTQRVIAVYLAEEVVLG